MKVLLSGNEAIARGAFEAGTKVAVGYPGTPSTEILENIVQYDTVYAQWSPNEKVAFEVGAGASIAGARTLVTMKHVGVNVAADPLLTFAYTGVNGGLVLISADDPGMHSSQNEQDNRNYAKFAKIPCLEPSNSQEAKDFVAAAMAISENFDTPVMLRTTTRVAHSQSLVEVGEPAAQELKAYTKNPQKFVMIPAYGRQRRLVVEERLQKLVQFAYDTNLNTMELNDTSFGIVTSGICYEYVKEAFPDASVLKLGLTYPLSAELIADFAGQVDRVFVVEELEPFLEEAIQLMGIKAIGKEIFPNIGELNAQLIRNKIAASLGRKVAPLPKLEVTDLPVAPVRPPVLCPGCPHRAVFYTLKKLKLVVSGDIGCYTLGSLAPLEAMDSCICMGASIGAALGMEKANPEFAGKTVAVIGDSTFFHSGITGLVDMVYNQGHGTVLILDNSTTAMTGHQEHPGTGKTLQSEITDKVNIAQLVKALGVKRLTEIDPFQLEALEAIIKEEVAAPEISVIIVKRPCILTVKGPKPPVTIDEDKCVGCMRCMKLGCPAIVASGEKVSLNSALCVGCNLCAQVCKVGAISKVGECCE